MRVIRNCFVMYTLPGSTVDGSVRIENTNCATLQASRFHASGPVRIGPTHVENVCNFSNAAFDHRAFLDVRAKKLDLSGAHLARGGQVLADEAEIILDQLSTGRSLRISGARGSTRRPCIKKLQGADAGSLVFAEVDMSQCMFYGANDLNGLVVEHTVILAKSGPCVGERRCIADELAWRYHAGGRHSRGWRCSPDLPTVGALQIASVYRELRRGLEAKSDVSGAADFYYGEMEMRRHAKETSYWERAIVWLYWAFSGYGLRERRPFVWQRPPPRRRWRNRPSGCAMNTDCAVRAVRRGCCISRSPMSASTRTSPTTSCLRRSRPDRASGRRPLRSRSIACRASKDRIAARSSCAADLALPG